MDNVLDIKKCEEPVVDNLDISSDLRFSQKCIKLLEKYRNCLTNFKNNCICEQNIANEEVFTHLEEDFNNLLEVHTLGLETNHRKSNIKIETIDYVFEDNCEDDDDDHNDDDDNDESKDNDFVPQDEDFAEDSNSEDNDLSDEEFTPTAKKATKRRTNTAASNGQKRQRKKYVYYNYTCDWVGCERKFSKRDDLMAHISSCHTNEKPFQCDLCSKCFAIEKFLKSHQKNHQNFKPKKKETEGSQPKSFVCDMNHCGKAFTSSGSLRKHQTTTHSDEKPYMCEWPGCSAAYKIKESLINHRAIHSDERQFKCDIEGCLKTFQTKWNYYSHMKAHRSQANPDRARKYPCDWPGCAFNGKSKQDLTIHMNRHMNIKPYKCGTVGCEMSYFTSYELKQHKIKVHEVVNECEREFKCHIDGCQKRYAVERDLKRHLRRHDRIYVCSWPECGQRYAAKQLLSDHMDRHMNVKSFHCHFVGCGKSFFSKTNYETHMKKIHKYNCNKNNKK